MGIRECKAMRDWQKLLNPAVVRRNLLLSSLFLSAYELLKQSIVDQPLSFFSHEFRDGEWVPSPEYKTKVLALDARQDHFRASAQWFKNMGALSQADLELLATLRQRRNDIAHELPKFLADSDFDVDPGWLSAIYDLVCKVDRWWIREIEIPTNPEFDDKELSDEDFQNSVSGNMMLIGYLRTIAAEGSPEHKETSHG